MALGVNESPVQSHHTGYGTNEPAGCNALQTLHHLLAILRGAVHVLRQLPRVVLGILGRLVHCPVHILTATL